MSKHKWSHPKSNEASTTAWRSAGQLEDTKEFRNWMDREFPQGAAELEIDDDGTSRRNFLQLMGGATALAGFGLTSCRRPEKYVQPYADAPEWVIPGKPTHYASVIPGAFDVTPVVVVSHEARPTKLEPNKLHPSGSGVAATEQASILDLYDPSRSKAFLCKGEVINRETFNTEFKKAVEGKKVAVLTDDLNSPTRQRLSQASEAKFYSYNATKGFANRKAIEEAFGENIDLSYDFSKAKRILSLDADFLGTETQGSVQGYYDNRKIEGNDYRQKKTVEDLNRLYVVEGPYSLTGGMADHRLRIAPSQVIKVASLIAKELGASVKGCDYSSLTTFQKKWAKGCAKDLKENKGQSVVVAGLRQSKELQLLAFAINEVLGAYGSAVKTLQAERKGFGTLEDLIADVKAGKVDAVVSTTPSNPVYNAPTNLEFSKTLKENEVALISLGLYNNATANCADLHAPIAHPLEQWNDYRSGDGTYTISQPLILPLHGGVSEIEVISAIDNKGDFAAVESGNAAGLTQVRETFNQVAKSIDDKIWKQALRDGFVAGTAVEASASLNLASVKVKDAPALPVAKNGQLELVFVTDSSVLDGRGINNPWLQEAPDPVSKITWDNAAYISPKTAKDLGIYDKIVELAPKSNLVDNFGAKIGPEIEKAKITDTKDWESGKRTAPVIEVECNGHKLKFPVMIAFGQAEGVIAIPTGYGQGYDENYWRQWEEKDFWYIGTGKNDPDLVDVTTGLAPKENTTLVGVNRGFNVNPFRSVDSDYIASSVSLEIRPERYKVAQTQEHHAMYGRALAREISTYGGDFNKSLKKVKKQGADSHAPENISLYKQRGSTEWWKKDSNGQQTALLSDKVHQWAMTIDLNVCNGCNACLVACQAENNIPIVGKEQVARGREMHWVRMDRYFAKMEYHGEEPSADKGDVDNVEMIPQPVACSQCESAPCETVCPVNATVHSEEGLNTMAYNRCIGTRYCANNCPYKVRRFNFFDYNKRNPLIDKNLYKGPAGKKQVETGAHLQRNPNVSVRMRGVMEKCTYCVQRLEMAKIKQKQVLKSKVYASGKPSHEIKIKHEDLRVSANEVKVACQSACPSEAIKFGNLLNEKDDVNAAKASKRNYDLLNYLNTKPRTSYLARVKNPYKYMPDAKYIGNVTVDMH